MHSNQRAAFIDSTLLHQFIFFFSLTDMCVFPGIKEMIVGMFTSAIERIFLNLYLSNSAGNNSINKTGIYFNV